MTSLLLDTSIIIDYLRNRDKENTILYKLSKDFQLKISIITHAELYAGKSVWSNTHAKKTLNLLVSGIKIVPLVKEISKLAGKIKSKHDSLGLIDAIIAATAITEKTALATLNIKHFEKIKSLKIHKTN